MRGAASGGAVGSAATPMPEIATTYLVLATPRSGSTLLGQALNATGLAGDPREHFGHKVGFWAGKWGTATLGDFVNRLLQERATANGVFGAKLLYAHLLHLEQVARAEPRFAALPLPAILAELFPHLHYLRITRRDKIRQAISYWKAKETGVWGREPARAGRTGQGRRAAVKGSRQTGRRPAFDYAGIDGLLQAILAEEAGIEAFFREAGIAPMHVVYEELADRYEETTREVLRFLGIEVPAGLVLGQPRTVKLADDETEEWVARFAAMRAEAAG